MFDNKSLVKIVLTTNILVFCASGGDGGGSGVVVVVCVYFLICRVPSAVTKTTRTRERIFRGEEL